MILPSSRCLLNFLPLGFLLDSFSVHCLLASHDPPCSKLLEMVHRTSCRLRCRETHQSLQLPNWEGEILRGYRGCSSVKSCQFGHQTSAKFQLQTRGLCLPERAKYCKFRVASLHHLLGSGAIRHLVTPHSSRWAVDQQFVRVFWAGTSSTRRSTWTWSGSRTGEAGCVAEHVHCCTWKSSET